MKYTKNIPGVSSETKCLNAIICGNVENKYRARYVKKALLVGCYLGGGASNRRKIFVIQRRPCSLFNISLRFQQEVTMWQIFPKLPTGPICVLGGVVMPVPHHVVSPPLNSMRCLVKLIL